MSENFNLPGSGYEVLSKILHAYALCGSGKTPLAEVSKKAGLNPTVVSRNNGFLVSIGALSPGRDKELTPRGSKLAIAVGNNLPEDIVANWKELLLHSDATRSVIEMVKVQKGVIKDQFTSRVASTLGVVTDANTKTGLNTLAELFLESKTLKVVDDKYVVHDEALVVKDIPDAPPQAKASPPDENSDTHKHKNSSENRTSQYGAALHVNVQIHISPESTPEQIEKIFECMAKHLRTNP